MQDWFLGSLFVSVMLREKALLMIKSRGALIALMDGGEI